MKLWFEGWNVNAERIGAGGCHAGAIAALARATNKEP